MKKRILAVIALVLLFGGTTLAFGYWDNLEQSQTDITIPVGEGVTLGVVVGDAVPAGKKLVPSGVIAKTDDVTSVTLTYTVSLDQAVTTDLNLTVTPSNIKIGGATTNAGLVNIVITNDNSDKVNSTDVTVTVVITLSEPSDVTAYEAIDLTNITFDLTFTAAQ